MIREQKHRLPKECYRGLIRCAFTLCVENHGELFRRIDIIRTFNQILKQELSRQRIRNWIYVYMPDHLHMIVEGLEESSDLWKAMVVFKQKTGFWLSKNEERYSWQKDFYDHLILSDAEFRKQVAYIIDNPVRKGLVKEWNEYAFMGSLDYEINDVAKLFMMSDNL